METGKPVLVSAPVHINAVAAQTEKRMDTQAPLTAVYIHTVPALPAQPFPQHPGAAREPATLHLTMPPLNSKETLPFLTLHIAGGLQSQPGLSLAAAAAAAAAPTVRPKSAGKHVCPHCGRDCLKPSVLEKHLRCHTGERPYPCTTCGVSFKTQSNLYKHKRTQAHARLSSESEQSSLGSLDSMSSSRETCTSSLSLDDRSEELGSMEKDATLSAAEVTRPADNANNCSVKKQGSVGEQNERTPADDKTKESSKKVTTVGENLRMESEKPQVTTTRHLPLQRQEATLFSKQWESSVSRGKSQSHESTDSGFSESSDHYPSPSSALPDHSMDSLTESTKEHLEETISTQIPEPGQSGQEPKDMAREQEQKTLEERISKLISENTAVVEDKQLENVRPRKTVLSKQGSIDLPMPYTYKDSFHFDMKNSKTANAGLQRNRKPGFYTSVPTQHSTSVEHAPLTRSNSLPFSVTLLQPEKSSPTSSYQSDYVTLVRRGSSGQINPTGFTIKSVNQQSSTHRPLVRQTAVDCNHATDGLFMNSSVEEACSGSLSCDGDGNDIYGEPSNRKFRRKKAQKFAYNKWYMYGGGTFKKLYNAEKAGDDSVVKGRKCLTNPEHEVVQGLQKRSSAIQREPVTTACLATNLTSSSVVCHPDCPPPKLSLISAVDLKTSQPYTSCSTVKAPLCRNLSLSIMPLPSVGSLISHKADSVSRAEAGRLINEEEHTESSSQLCGAHSPSDRKKQKTDDKIICPLEMETDPNTLTHPPPSVTGRTQQDTNLSYINLQKNQNHTQLKGAFFPTCIINANTPSVSTSTATSTPSAAKTSFLPKYQLKLPNAPEPDSNHSAQVVEKPTGSDGHNFTSALSFSHTEQTSPSVTTSEKKCSDPITSPLIQSCDIRKRNDFCSTQGLSPYTATTFCPANTSRLNKNVTSGLAVVHRQSAATTITTTCLQDFQTGICSTSVQPTKSAGGSASIQLPRSAALVVANFPAAPTITTENKQTAVAAITALSQIHPNPHPSMSHAQLLPASDQLNPVNRVYASSNTQVVPCHVVPFDQMQPAAQNVFHVHTADLQICLQIISDEQLALIEPQIERQTGSILSQRHDVDAVASEGTQNTVQSSVTMEGSSEGRDHQKAEHKKELDQSESLPTPNMERRKPSLSVQFGKAEQHHSSTEHSISTQVTESTESNPHEAHGSSQHPHKHSQVNMVTEALSVGDVSPAASLKGVKSGGSQTSEEEHALSVNHCAEMQLLPDRRVSQGGLVSQMLSGQTKLSMTSLSSSTVNKSSMRTETLGKDSRQKLKNQGATRNVSTMKAKVEACPYKSSRLQSGETDTPLQDGLGQASGAACANELSGSVSSIFHNKCTPSRQLNPQASIYCRDPEESTFSEALNSSKHANRGCDRLGCMDDRAPLQEMSESQDTFSSARSEKQLGQFTPVSSDIQVERPKNIPAVLASSHSPPPGRDSLVGCGAHKEQQTQVHGGAPGQPNSTDWRPNPSQEFGDINHQCMEGQGGGGIAGEDKDRRVRTDEETGQWSKVVSDSRYTYLKDMTPEGEDRKTKTDSFKNSWPSEKHLQHFSQTHSGMSECPPQNSQPAQSTSNNLDFTASSGQTSLFNSPQQPLEMNSLYFSQQHCESSSIHNQQTQILCKSNTGQHMKAQTLLTETQNAFLRTESSPEHAQTFSHQDQKQTGITLSVQQGNTPAGNSSTAVSCCSTLTLQSHKILSPDVKTSPSTHPGQASYCAGFTGNTQVSNSSMLDNNSTLPSKPFTYTQPDDGEDIQEKASSAYISQSSNSGRSDITNKYQSFFLAGQLHGYQPAECLTSGVRPVQSCQDYTEDTSSSDDEGKLIIEL